MALADIPVKKIIEEFGEDIAHAVWLCRGTSICTGADSNVEVVI